MIFAGRTFTRRMYAKYAKLKDARVGNKLKPHYHVRIDSEFCLDCGVWRVFLENYRNLAVCHLMVDLNKTVSAETLNFYSDTSANSKLGFGTIFNNQWIFAQWEPGYINEYQPSIEYLELFTLTAALLTWGTQLKNQRISIFCNNQAVVSMENNLASSCHNCMKLLRLITLNNLITNRRVFTLYVCSSENILSDTLSRLQFKCFWNHVPGTMNSLPSVISPIVWPASKIWERELCA